MSSATLPCHFHASGLTFLTSAPETAGEPPTSLTTTLANHSRAATTTTTSNITNIIDCFHRSFRHRNRSLHIYGSPPDRNLISLRAFDVTILPTKGLPSKRTSTLVEIRQQTSHNVSALTATKSRLHIAFRLEDIFASHLTSTSHRPRQCSSRNGRWRFQHDGEQQ